MKIESSSGLLNVFRHVGDKVYWEDNVTRALLCVITRSAAGGLILREILDRCVEIATAPRPEQIEAAHRAACTLSAVEVSTQHAFRDGEVADDELTFAILVELTPTRRSPLIPGSEPALGIRGAGRFDGYLDCASANDVRFAVAIESKLYGHEHVDKLEKYAQHFGIQRCIRSNLTWSFVLDVLESLPTVCKSDPLVTDLADFLVDMHWLVGFRGFRSSDFTERDRARRFHNLRELANSLCAPDCEMEFVATRSLRTDAGDIDVYVRDQFLLLGNVGLASWDHQSLRAKLVIGSFSYKETADTELTTRLRTASGQEFPRWQSYWATKALLSADRDSVVEVIWQASQQDPLLGARVGFRCFFNRFEDYWLSSKPTELASRADVHQLIEWLQLAEDSGEITSSTLDAIEHVLDKVSIPDLQAVRALREQKPNPPRKPTHHGSLLFSTSLETERMVGVAPEQCRQYAGNALSRLHGLLRELSNLASPEH